MLRYTMPGETGVGLSVDALGRLAQVEGPLALRQALLLMLATRPGERLGRPEFGCALDRLVFEPNDATTAGLAIRLVADAIERLEPRAEIVELDAGPDADDPSVLRIALTFRDRQGGAEDRLALSVNLAGA